MHASITALHELRHSPDWTEWQHLSRNAPPFLTPEFFTLAARFEGGSAVVAEAWDGDTLVAALPLVRHGDRLVGLRCAYTPSYDLSGSAEGVDAIWTALQEDTTWNELELGKLPAASPLVARIASLAARDGAPITIRLDSRHLYLPTAGAFDRLTPKFRTNLLRCERKAGGVELERIAIPDRAAFDEALEIEAMAWKGAAGTSIDTDPRAENLYRVMAKLVGRRGHAALYFLRAKGRRIATLFCVDDGYTLYALKIGYDPAMSNLSPGHLLVWKVLLDAEARGLRELDFVGRDDEWKRKWTDRVHEHVSLAVYRNDSVGLARYALRHLLRPRLPPALRGGIRDALPRHCQREDLLGEHSVTERVVGRVQRGLGIKSALLRIGKKKPAPAPREGGESAFSPGSWVRVKSADEIRATLDERNRTRGLAFTDAQWETAGRVYRVDRIVRRLRDDHGTYRPVSRTVLLEHVDCAGSSTEAAGCGRHCPMMYRDEWLEAATQPPHLVEARPSTGQFARVRNLDEIRAGLDLWGRRDGVTFMPEMAAHAGKRFPIAGALTKVFELDRWLETRAPCYILAGLHCTGAISGTKGPCHRACSLIWHRDWLIIESTPAAA